MLSMKKNIYSLLNKLGMQTDSRISKKFFYTSRISFEMFFKKVIKILLHVSLGKKVLSIEKKKEIDSLVVSVD